MKHTRFVVVLALLVVLTTSCKKDEGNPSGNSNPPDRRGTYAGAVADPAGGGALTMNVGVAKVVDILPVTGVFRPASGGSVTLSGTYNTANDSLYVSGGGYTFAGRFGGGQISGTCITPNGPGIFSVAVSTAANPVKVYTGSFSLTSGQHGPFNMMIPGTTLSVVAYIIPDNASFRGTGTVQGTNLTVIDTQSNRMVATGTISNNGTSVGGSTLGSDGQPNGSWSGTLVQ